MHDYKAVEQEAERIAPYPKVEPASAGIGGLFIVGLAMVVFLGLAGIEEEGNPRIMFAICVMCAAGFAGPFIYFNNQKRRHWREWARLDRLARERDAERP